MLYLAILLCCFIAFYPLLRFCAQVHGYRLSSMSDAYLGIAGTPFAHAYDDAAKSYDR